MRYFLLWLCAMLAIQLFIIFTLHQQLSALRGHVKAQSLQLKSCHQSDIWFNDSDPKVRALRIAKRFGAEMEKDHLQGIRVTETNGKESAYFIRTPYGKGK